jgi:hypothetical protein
MRELVQNYPAWSNETDEFDHNVTVWKEGDNYYHPAIAFHLESLPTPKPIPMALFRGLWHSSLTECPHPLPANSYLKSPRILLPEDYDFAAHEVPDEEGIHSIRVPRDDMIAEAEIYEILKRHPHPNICIYHGCVRDGAHFTALCLKKYRRTLDAAILGGDCSVDRGAILDGISKGLGFLHDVLGLVHNDINPSNIMLDDKGIPVIIDFDSCMAIGHRIGNHKAGTFGWMKEPAPSISLPENDFHALDLIAELMRNKS